MEFLTIGLTVNSDRHCATLRSLKQRIRRIRPERNTFLKCQHFSSDAEIEAAVRKWISSQPATFFMDGMNKWIERFKKCVALNGDYVEK